MNKKLIIFGIAFPVIIFFLLSMLFSLLIIFFIFVGRPYKVMGYAMSPTYNNGAYVFAMKRFLKTAYTPNRYDIVVFGHPHNEDIDYIKRVIGLPGEKLKLTEGKIIINGKTLDEKFIASDVYTSPGKFLLENKEIIIPDNNIFVIGDNRSSSSDSREWGFVPIENIRGKVNFCYWGCY
jgi:signal peptidase I